MSSNNSLSEVFSSIEVPVKGSFWRRMFAFTGPGLLVAVGYMDPGNWATDIAGGSKYGYALLFVILLSSVFATILQYLSLKLGIVYERDLARACKEHYGKATSVFLWIICEFAIIACDIAEVIGAAIALNLLFHIPLPLGVAITAVDVLILLFFQSKGFRIIESIVATLIIIVMLAFGIELLLSHPSFFPVLSGFIPSTSIVSNPSMLYIAIGILGATVMPHNLYLHSSIVQTRNYPRTESGKKMALKFATIDSSVALFFAFFINAAILIVAAASFHLSGHSDVADISNAYQLLTPLLGTALASTLFAVALLASGLNSTLTGTMAGQIVMEGFLNLKMKPWVRRFVTRLIAIIPAMAVSIIYGSNGVTKLLILSQVILSMQLSFAVIPLVLFTNDSRKMGVFANGIWMRYTAWVIAILILGMNMYLLVDVFFG